MLCFQAVLLIQLSVKKHTVSSQSSSKAQSNCSADKTAAGAVVKPSLASLRLRSRALFWSENTCHGLEGKVEYYEVRGTLIKYGFWCLKSIKSLSLLSGCVIHRKLHVNKITSALVRELPTLVSVVEIFFLNVLTAKLAPLYRQCKWRTFPSSSSHLPVCPGQAMGSARGLLESGPGSRLSRPSPFAPVPVSEWPELCVTPTGACTVHYVIA